MHKEWKMNRNLSQKGSQNHEKENPTPEKDRTRIEKHTKEKHGNHSDMKLSTT